MEIEMDLRNLIKSMITDIQVASSKYEAIEDLQGLPSEFSEVKQHLPLVESTLRLARDSLPVGESQRNVIHPSASGCKEKAKMLQDIFQNVEAEVRETKDGSVLDSYRKSLLRLGKTYRVETLMQGILGGLIELAADPLWATAIYAKMANLDEAFNHLSSVKSSVPDSVFKSSGTNFTQNIASGGTGYQSHYSGQGQQINTGSGTMNNYKATTMNFAQSGDDDEVRRKIHQKLYASNYVNAKNRNPDRIPGTCEWFVGHKHFRQWRERKSSTMLWVSANPGCGKSVLAKYLVDNIKTTESRTTCYFFFKDDFEDQRSARSALSCILHQLFTQREDLFSENIIRRFKAYKTPLSNSYYELWELWDVLIMAAQERNAGEMICILDGFDECEDQDRQELAKSLCNFYGPESDTKRSVIIKFLITSRPYDKIRRDFITTLNLPQLPVIYLRGEGDAEVGKIIQEINVYMKYRVSRFRTKFHLSANEEQLLLERLVAVRNETYLWVYLILDWIEKEIGHEINLTEIRRVTSTLPKTIDDAYDKILSKCKKPKRVKKLLHIIVAAERPLTLAEMDLALAIRPDHNSYQDLDPRPDDRVGKDIRDLCGLFVNIIDKKVYLLHQTAKEFLVPKWNLDAQENDPISQQDSWKHSLHPAESHRILCNICIWNLLFTELEDQPLDERGDNISEYLGNKVFLDYSAVNWAEHFRSSDIEEDSFIEPLQRICDATSRRCVTWFMIFWSSTQAQVPFPQGFTTLMMASYFGLQRIVETQLELKDVQVDSRDSVYGRTALSWASENGFDGVVKLLIKGPKLSFKTAFKLSFSKRAKVDAKDVYLRTPLSYAALNGHGDTIRRLVKAGASVDSEDAIGGTPIAYALCAGQRAIADKLMKGFQADSVAIIRRDLLLSAARNGHEQIIKRLLDKGADIDGADSHGRTPLSMAAGGGHVGVARLLLKTGTNVEAKEHNGRTALDRAIENGSVDIFEMLLRSGAKLDYIFEISVISAASIPQLNK